MNIDLEGPRRILYALGTIAALHVASIAAADSPAAAAARPMSAVFGATAAQAQTYWGVARRTARRTTRRVVRRDEYMYAGAAAATAATVAADQCYFSDNRRYCPQMMGGEVVYVVVS